MNDVARRAGLGSPGRQLGGLLACGTSFPLLAGHPFSNLRRLTNGTL
jgi:hypothetical protein